MVNRWLVTVMVVTVLVATSCSGRSTPSPEQPLLAVLQANNTNAALLWNTVVIADHTGKVRSSASFAPLPTPFVGCAGAVLPWEAHVAAGKVFYAAGDGVVRSLDRNGHVATAMTLPLRSSQQMLSFAVSPDGKQLLGSIFTLPARPNTLPNCGIEPFRFEGSFTLDVFAASAGGPTRLIDHEDLPMSANMTLPNVMAFIGWDALGPLATYPTLWATQGGGPMHYFGIPVRVDAATGKVTEPVADPDRCWVLDMAANGDFLCTVTGSDALSLRRADGSEVWRPAGSMTNYQLAFLSPNENRVVRMGVQNDLVSRGGGVMAMPEYMPVGWLDADTVIAARNDFSLKCISVSGPPVTNDMDLRGLFVGAIEG